MAAQRRRLAIAQIALGLGTWATGSTARARGGGPVRVLVGAAPGGPSDLLARLFSDAVGQELAMPFVVENRAGASGSIAADAASRLAMVIRDAGITLE